MSRRQKRQKKNPPVPAGLSHARIESYYRILDEEISEIDCGTLCATMNHGVPLCCSTKFAIPLLYKSELEFLNGKSDLWSPWTPVSPREKKLALSADAQEIYCQCRGVEHCIRDERSLACRTFPLEPYLEDNGSLSGLVFVPPFFNGVGGDGPECPLRNRPELIRSEYICASLKFWKTFLEMPAEFATYMESSRELRRRSRKKGEGIQVLTCRS